MDLKRQIFSELLQRLAEIRCSVWPCFVTVFGRVSLQCLAVKLQHKLFFHKLEVNRRSIQWHISHPFFCLEFYFTFTSLRLSYFLKEKDNARILEIWQHLHFPHYQILNILPIKQQDFKRPIVVRL